MRELIEGNQVFALRMLCVAFCGAEVTDVVRHWNLVDHFPRAEFPFGHGTFDEERCVSISLIVKLSMEWSKAHIHLSDFDSVIIQNGDAIFIPCEVFLLDCGLDLVAA